MRCGGVAMRPPRRFTRPIAWMALLKLVPQSKKNKTKSKSGRSKQRAYGLPHCVSD
jgi:hypothetical protein